MASGKGLVRPGHDQPGERSMTTLPHAARLTQLISDFNVHQGGRLCELKIRSGSTDFSGMLRISWGVKRSLLLTNDMYNLANFVLPRKTEPGHMVAVSPKSPRTEQPRATMEDIGAARSGAGKHLAVSQSEGISRKNSSSSVDGGRRSVILIPEITESASSGSVATTSSHPRSRRASFFRRGKPSVGDSDRQMDLLSTPSSPNPPPGMDVDLSLSPSGAMSPGGRRKKSSSDEPPKLRESESAVSVQAGVGEPMPHVSPAAFRSLKTPTKGKDGKKSHGGIWNLQNRLRRKLKDKPKTPTPSPTAKPEMTEYFLPPEGSTTTLHVTSTQTTNEVWSCRGIRE